MTGRTDDPIHDIDGEQFPAFVAELWERDGWETERAGDEWDDDVDVVARRDGVTILLRTEAADQSSAVTVGDVEACEERLADEGVDGVTIVAPGQVTSAARSQASTSEVDITDAVELDILLREQGAEDLAREFAAQEGESDAEEADAVSESVREVERDQARREAREFVVQGLLALLLAGTLVYIAIRLAELL